MKKMIAVLALFAFGMMVGCGDDTKPKSGSTTASPSGTVSHTSTAPPADTKK